MIEIICTIISAGAGILVAILSLYIKGSEKRARRDAELRQRESLLSLKMMDATLKLSVENSIGIMSGDNFDNIQDALDKANSVSSEYQAFMQEVTAHEIGK